MNGFEIEKIISKFMCGCGSNFAGVFAADEIPERFAQYPVGYVINTDPRALPGQHWVAYYHSSPNSNEFFDSYGNPPSTFSLKTFPQLTYNKLCFQELDSDVCGQYCIFYLYKRSKNFSLDYITKILSNARTPDQFVSQFCKSLKLTQSVTECSCSEPMSLTSVTSTSSPCHSHVGDIK